MSKKHFIFIFVLVFLVFLNLSAKKKDKYEKWMDEVNSIIADAEKAEFKKLKRKRKGVFYQAFLGKKRPHPSNRKKRA